MSSDAVSSASRQPAPDEEVVTELPQVVPIQSIYRPDGTLGVIESYRHSPFSYARFYFLTNLAEDSARGEHAHKTLRQVFVCLRGAVTIDIRTPSETRSFRLDAPDRALILPPGYWRHLHGFAEGTLVGVLASANYDETDYLRNWNDYTAWHAARRRKTVPYLDLARYAPLVGHRMADAMREVVVSGQLIGGPQVQDFERAFAAYCGTEEAIGVGNGLQALTLALRAYGIGPGDEVILPANTFIATAFAVLEAGAVPVLVDVEEATGLISVAATRTAITEKTAAIIPVHLYGHPADMDALVELVRNRQIMLLEDACQAHGARYKGRRCGALGDAAAFSFYPTKNLGALGDAGAVTTGDRRLAERIRLAGNYGSQQKYEHVTFGTNSRLDPLQAAALKVKLPHLDGWNARRADHATRYLAGLAGLYGLALPHVHAWAEPVWHVFPVRVAGGRRDALIAHLTAQGIGTNIHYPKPIHLQDCFRKRGWKHGNFPVSERLAQQLVSLPLDPTHTADEIDRVIVAVREFFPAQAPVSAEIVL